MENRAEWRRQKASWISADWIAEVLRCALPSFTLSSFELLPGGSTNLNFLLRSENASESLVLRICAGDSAACEKELVIWRAAAPILPVPEIVWADVRGGEDIGPYLIYRFAEGLTFQELKAKGNLLDLAGAAYAMGRVLARVQQVPLSSASGMPGRSPEDTGECLQSALLLERVGGRQRDRLHEFLAPWWQRIQELNAARTLVHGDFNNRNTILRRENDSWVVSGILDWEAAFAGSPLWDAARFLCYENRSRPHREPHFSRGFCDGGGSVPEDWHDLRRVINTLTAANGLSSPGLAPDFIPELRDLVGAFLDHRDAG